MPVGNFKTWKGSKAERIFCRMINFDILIGRGDWKNITSPCTPSFYCGYYFDLDEM